MGIVVIGAVFVDIKGYPLSTYIPGGRNAGRVEQVHGGVCRNVAEDIANVELRPTFVSLVDDTGSGQDVIDKLARLHPAHAGRHGHLAGRVQQRRRCLRRHLEAARHDAADRIIKGKGRRDLCRLRRHRHRV